MSRIQQRFEQMLRPQAFKSMGQTLGCAGT